MHIRETKGEARESRDKEEEKRFPLLRPLVRRDEQQDFLWNKRPSKDKGWTAGGETPDIEEEETESVDQIPGERERERGRRPNTNTLWGRSSSFHDLLQKVNAAFVPAYVHTHKQYERKIYTLEDSLSVCEL